jgi:putative ABC transport system ATP-binding protein
LAGSTVRRAAACSSTGSSSRRSRRAAGRVPAYPRRFVFQAFGLIPILTAAENVEVLLRLGRTELERRQRTVRELLDLVGLVRRAHHRPPELSGGEQQRVAVVRALANDPPLILADEPTAQLDADNARTVVRLIRELVKSRDATAIVATHDPLLLEAADRVIELGAGRIQVD